MERGSFFRQTPEGPSPYICGTTSSIDLPVTPDALQPVKGEGSTGYSDGFFAIYSFGPDAVCGDGICDPGESPCSCPGDCGAPPASETDCTNGADDDCDGLADCADADCAGVVAEICDNGVDDDCDGLADCDDVDCSAGAACVDPCGDGICDVGGGEDPCSCPEDCGTPPPSEIDCANGADDDCDGLIDCDDLDCAGSADCPSCAPKNAPCTSNGDCCSGDCNTKNGRCRGGDGGGVELANWPFIRGDANRDGLVDLSDSLTTLGWLFLGDRKPSCDDAADANDDGALAVSDAVYMLAHLFSGGSPPPAPWPDHGDDPTPDTLGCMR